jgi:hypothetical protein
VSFPLVCKVFERCILSICEDLLFVDQLQFGFKYVHKLYLFFMPLFITSSMEEVLFALLLQSSDCVNHVKTFLSLSLRGVPDALIDKLKNWCSKLTVNVK